MTTTHTDCLHDATKAGRTKCRAAGGPAAYAEKRILDIIDSFTCGDCATSAFSTAWDIMTSEGGLFADRDPGALNAIILRSHIWRYAQDIADEYDSCHCLAHDSRYN
jgi:hypothetical protein